MAPPEGDGYDWIWEDWVKEQQEKREKSEQPSGGVSEGNWMEAFEQYFYGNQGEEGVSEQVDEKWNQVGPQGDVVNQQDYEMVSQQGQVVNQRYEVSREYYQVGQQDYQMGQQQDYQVGQQQDYQLEQDYQLDQQQYPNPPQQQTYHLTPIPTIPEYAQDTTEPIPTVPVIPPQEETINLYNTDQCIHTYNVVNTVEEVAELNPYYADPHSRRHPHPADRTHEDCGRNHGVRTVLPPATHSRQRPLRQRGATTLLSVEETKE